MSEFADVAFLKVHSIHPAFEMSFKIPPLCEEGDDFTKMESIKQLATIEAVHMVRAKSFINPKPPTETWPFPRTRSLQNLRVQNPSSFFAEEEAQIGVDSSR